MVLPFLQGILVLLFLSGRRVARTEKEGGDASSDILFQTGKNSSELMCLRLIRPSKILCQAFYKNPEELSTLKWNIPDFLLKYLRGQAKITEDLESNDYSGWTFLAALLQDLFYSTWSFRQPDWGSIMVFHMRVLPSRFSNNREYIT